VGSVRCVMRVDVLILLLSSGQTVVILITKGGGGWWGRGWCGQCHMCDDSKDRNYPHQKRPRREWILVGKGVVGGSVRCVMRVVCLFCSSPQYRQGIILITNG
jgi:hypothetical protein